MKSIHDSFSKRQLSILVIVTFTFLFFGVFQNCGKAPAHSDSTSASPAGVAGNTGSGNSGLPNTGGISITSTPQSSSSSSAANWNTSIHFITTGPVPTGPKRWKIQLADEFKGPGSAYGAAYPLNGQNDSFCYSENPICDDSVYGGTPKACSTSNFSNLTNLNKCIWAVNDVVNTGGRFDSTAVSVDPSTDNGVLILSSNLSYKPNSNSSCNGFTSLRPGYCPYTVSGGIDSGATSGPGHPGYFQTGGLIQMRAKLPPSYSSWGGSALWMIGANAQGTTNWPETGEFDLVEFTWNNHDQSGNYYASNAAQTAIAATCYDPLSTTTPYQFLGINWSNYSLGCLPSNEWNNHIRFNSNAGSIAGLTANLSQDYHTYTLNWDPGTRATFAIDNLVTNDVHNAQASLLNPSFGDSNAFPINTISLPMTPIGVNQGGNITTFSYPYTGSACSYFNSADVTHVGANCEIHVPLSTFSPSLSYVFKWGGQSSFYPQGIYYPPQIGACSYGGSAFSVGGNSSCLISTNFIVNIPEFVPTIADPMILLLSNGGVADNQQLDVPSTHLSVDYIRAWSQCKTGADYCPLGGTFGADQICSGIMSGYVSPCTLCTSGGTEVGSNCNILSLTSSTSPVPTNSVYQGVQYSVDSNSANPGVYYNKVNGGCPYGGVSSGWICKLQSFSGAQVHQGTGYWVDTNPSHPGVYYSKVNGSCSYGGTVADQNNCLIYSYSGSLPPMVFQNISYWVDTNPSWAGIFYSQVNGGCPYGGTTAGSNCELYSLPQGKTETNIHYWVDVNTNAGVIYTPLVFPDN